MKLTDALQRKIRSIAAEGHNSQRTALVSRGHDSQRTASWYQEVVKLYCDFLVQKGLAPTVSNLTVDNVEWFLSELRANGYVRKDGTLMRRSPNTIANRARWRSG